MMAATITPRETNIIHEVSMKIICLGNGIYSVSIKNATFVETSWSAAVRHGFEIATGLRAR